MDSHVKEYFRQYSDDTPSGKFHRVIPLHDSPHIVWEEVHQLVPRLCKGWYELGQLSPADRIEFLKDFWFATMPYLPQLSKAFNDFFNSIDDVGIFITQQSFDDPFEVQLVYSCKKDMGYFRGLMPANDEEISRLQKSFPDYTFPPDYLAFLQIHNGFCKATDTGIIPTSKMLNSYQQFQQMLEQQEIITTLSGEPVDPKTLVPFYESFGMPFYQCFWTEWYPAGEMGNVYYSGVTKKISDINLEGNAEETMTFPTFTDWLMFYLELVEK